MNWVFSYLSHQFSGNKLCSFVNGALLTLILVSEKGFSLYGHKHFINETKDDAFFSKLIARTSRHDTY